MGDDFGAFQETLIAIEDAHHGLLNLDQQRAPSLPETSLTSPASCSA